MAYSTLDNLFGTYINQDAGKRPCVIGTGATTGARAWEPAPRRNFVSTIAPSPLLTPYEMLKRQPWTAPPGVPDLAFTTRPRNIQAKY